ncbi:hypothetical protein V8D89_013536 [Ganoderma adspersum]
MSTVPELPNELVDAIISWVSPYDKRTLRSCALVHRDWLPASLHALLWSVELREPAAWDSFLNGVIHSEQMRPWRASIHHLEFVDPLIHTHYPGDKCVPPGSIPTWRGQYVITVLASHLPNLHSLTFTVDWAQCSPHPTTFGTFSQLTSLCRLQLDACSFPSFCTFRRVLISLPALKNLNCIDVHWPSAPQLSILALPSSRPPLQSLYLSFSCRSCTLALLEWLIHTPTSSTLVDLHLYPPRDRDPPQEHRITLPDRHLDYYTQIFAPAIRTAFLCHVVSEDIVCRITLSRFDNLDSLHLEIRRDDWSRVADMLKTLSARLNTLCLLVSPEGGTRNDDLLVEEDGELKAMKSNGLELLDPVLSRDNFKDLSYLYFGVGGYCDTLSLLRRRTLECIRQKLPTLYKRKALDIQLRLDYCDRDPAILMCSHSGRPAACQS